MGEGNRTGGWRVYSCLMLEDCTWVVYLYSSSNSFDTHTLVKYRIDIYEITIFILLCTDVVIRGAGEVMKRI